MFEEGQTEAQLLYLFLFRTKLVLTTIKNSDDPDELPEFNHVTTMRVSYAGLFVYPILSWTPFFSIQLDKYEMKEDKEEKSIMLQPTDATQKSYKLMPIDSQNTEFVIQAWVKDIAEAKEGIGEWWRHFVLVSEGPDEWENSELLTTDVFGSIYHVDQLASLISEQKFSSSRQNISNNSCSLLRRFDKTYSEEKL